MERTPLPNLVALAKTMSATRGIKEVFALAVSPPNEEDIERGVLSLKEVILSTSWGSFLNFLVLHSFSRCSFHVLF